MILVDGNWNSTACINVSNMLYKAILYPIVIYKKTCQTVNLTLLVQLNCSIV